MAAALLALLMLTCLYLSKDYLNMASDYLVSSPVKWYSDPLTPAVTEEEIAGHVGFLAQPALKGRRPMSLGSWHARRFIEDRFRAYGLAPWGEAQGYGQRVLIGTNVVGVLPGTDPKYRHEIALVCAHYDHLGGKRLGACDNASGVAALLEIAERFAMDKQRPKRSICFAAFDCEELGLFGATAFTLREDFDPKTIVAAINIDMLGRRFFSSPENALLLGAEEIPDGLMEPLRGLAQQLGTRVIPYDPVLVGPRGEHAAFAALDVPYIFFSCGQYEGYHRKEDTQDKLDYAEIRRSTEVIAEVVYRLANNPDSADTTADVDELTRRDLAAYTFFRAALPEDEEDAEESAKSAARPAEVIERGEELLAQGSIECGAREALRHEFLTALQPDIEKSGYSLFFGWVSSGKDSRKSACAEGVLLWSRYGDQIFGAYRDYVGFLLKGSLAQYLRKGVPDFTKRYRFTTRKDDVHFSPDGDSSYLLEAMPSQVRCDFIAARSAGDVSVRIEISSTPFRVGGTREELVDACLLRWLQGRYDELSQESIRTCMRSRGRSEEEVETIVKMLREGFSLPSYDNATQQILQAVADDMEGATCADQLAGRAAALGLGSVEEWGAGCLRSSNPDVVAQALGCLPKFLLSERRDTLLAAVSSIAQDRQRPAGSRALAVRQLAAFGGAEHLETLVDLLDDTTAVEDELPYWRSHELFGAHPLVVLCNGVESEKPPETTLGELATEMLKRIAKDETDRDAPAWRVWVEKNGTAPEVHRHLSYPAVWPEYEFRLSFCAR